MVFASLPTAPHPIILLSLLFLNIGFIIIILACFVVTLSLDTLRHPWGTRQFIWKNWWHTPLLAYISILTAVLIPLLALTPASYIAVPTIGFLPITIAFILWVYVTHSDPFSLPRDSTQKKHVLWAANILIITGSLCSFIILSLNLLLWITSLVGIAVLILGILLYFTGFFLRVSTTGGLRTEDI